MHLEPSLILFAHSLHLYNATQEAKIRNIRRTVAPIIHLRPNHQSVSHFASRPVHSGQHDPLSSMGNGALSQLIWLWWRRKIMPNTAPLANHLSPPFLLSASPTLCPDHYIWPINKWAELSHSQLELPAQELVAGSWKKGSEPKEWQLVR